MRKEKKQAINVTISTVSGYHASTDWNTNYAYQGFAANKYFTSDRFIALDSNFRRPDGKPLQGYGLEIETECSSINDSTVYAELLSKVVLSPFPADLFKLQRDGSLDGNSSAEIISQVMTREAIRNMYPAFKAMYDRYFPAMDIDCYSSGNCGMHVNISNAVFGATEEKQIAAIRKLLFVTNRHYDLMCALTHRNPNRTHFCNKMWEYASIDGAKNANLYRMPSSHGNCFNGSHFPEGRIELRIVGGQRNYACFRNTMESIFHLCKAVRKLSWNDLDDVVTLFAGCNQYVYDRLKSYVKDAGQITNTQLAAIRATVVPEELL